MPRKVAPHPSVAADPLILERTDERWRRKGGASLESALQVDPKHGDSPVALVDARYIIKLWKQKRPVVRRQDLPRGVYRSRHRQAPAERQRLLPSRHRPSSHRGSSPTTRTQEGQPQAARQGTRAVYRGQGVGFHGGIGYTYAVFFDFMSCFQAGPDGTRTARSWRCLTRPLTT